MYRISNQRSQRGVALIIVLVLLLVITVAGLSSMESTTLQERMAGNLRDQSLSFNMAEASLRSAEAYLQQNVIATFDGTTTGLYDFNDDNAPDWKEAATGSWVVRNGTVDGLSQQPNYIIEKLPPVYDTTQSVSADQALPDSPLYRVTARGYGSTNGSGTVLQSVFKR